MSVIWCATRIFTMLGMAAALSFWPFPVRVGADPAGFPDLDSFATAAAEDYFVTYIRGRRIVAFSTPYDLMCDFAAPADLLDPPTPRLHCAGDLPRTYIGRTSTGQSQVTCTAGTVDLAPSGRYELMPSGWKCGDTNFRLDDFPYWSGRLLDHGKKLSHGNITCAVGLDYLIACRDTSGGEQHGFVIEPSGSRVF